MKKIGFWSENCFKYGGHFFYGCKNTKFCMFRKKHIHVSDIYDESEIVILHLAWLELVYDDKDRLSWTSVTFNSHALYYISL